MYAGAAEDADKITRFTSSKVRERINQYKNQVEETFLPSSLHGMMNSYRFFILFSSIKPTQNDFGSSTTLLRRCKRTKRESAKKREKYLRHHLSMTFFLSLSLSTSFCVHVSLRLCVCECESMCVQLSSCVCVCVVCTYIEFSHQAVNI